jgi:NDP-sugar pyrophosphorylase family protein
MRALILAAGEGQRLRPLTETMPKPMLSIAGRPILEHNVHLLRRYGIGEIAINLHHHPEAILQHFGDGSTLGTQIRYSSEPTLLGTAGALVPLRDFFADETFFVVYGDNLSTCDLNALLASHRTRKAEVTIALFHRKDVTASGVVTLDAQERVVSFIEKPTLSQAPDGGWVNAGILACEPSILAHIDRTPYDFGRDVFPALLAQERTISGYRMDEGESLWWVDSPKDYERTCAELAVTNTSLLI